MLESAKVSPQSKKLCNQRILQSALLREPPRANLFQTRLINHTSLASHQWTPVSPHSTREWIEVKVVNLEISCQIWMLRQPWNWETLRETICSIHPTLTPQSPTLTLVWMCRQAWMTTRLLSWLHICKAKRRRRSRRSRRRRTTWTSTLTPCSITASRATRSSTQPFSQWML